LYRIIQKEEDTKSILNDMSQNKEQESQKLGGLVWILVLGALAPLLDSTVVNVALPSLGRDLNTTVALSQWTITGYLLAMGIIIPVSGWLLERIGGKKLWLIALSVFLIGSVLAGLSWNIESMIVFRVIQGAAAGIITPLMTTLLIRGANGGSLGKLMATAGLPVVVVPILGPVVAGIILDHLDWRWIFFINIPIVITAVALAWWKQPKDDPSLTKHRFDLAGLIQLAPGLTLIFYGLSRAATTHTFNDNTVYLPIIAGIVLLTTFAVYALRTANPLIDLKALRVRAYSSSLLILFFTGLSVYGPLLLISLFYQNVQHQTVLMTGVLLAPQGLGSLLPRLFVSKLIYKIGPKLVIIFGLTLATIGTLPFAFANASTNEWVLAVALFIRGLGLTPIFVAVMVGAFQGLPKEEVPNASSTTRIIQQIGGSFGTAALTVILTSALVSQVNPSHAFNEAFWWSSGFAALVLIPTLLLPKFIKK
jgi:EmrB/QacA subfamily drug resistance transporter